MKLPVSLETTHLFWLLRSWGIMIGNAQIVVTPVRSSSKFLVKSVLGDEIWLKSAFKWHRKAINLLKNSSY